MPEPEPNPNPTPPEPTPPAPTPATNDTPLGIANSEGWTTVGDLLTAYNKAAGALANPQAPEQYTIDGIAEHWKTQGMEFNHEDPDFQALAASLRDAGVSQKSFEKTVLAYQARLNEAEEKSGTEWAQAATAKVGGQEKLDALFASADKAGIGKVARHASPDELLVINRMLNATSKPGVLQPPPPGSPPGAPPPTPADGDGTYPEGCYAKIGEEVVGINPADNASFQSFMQVKIGADKDGNGGQLFYRTPKGQQIYRAAQEQRKALLRSGGTSVMGAATKAA